jgi:hypothetical protein
MPEKMAPGRLTSRIAALPDGWSERGGPETVAARPVALLPHRIIPAIQARPIDRLRCDVKMPPISGR